MTQEHERPRIGVLAIQGDYAAHAEALAEAGAEPVEVRKPEQLAGLDGLILPGGESTTVLRFLEKRQFFDLLLEFCAAKPVFGTCAGAILLAREVRNPPQRSLGVLDAVVERNAYGRQIDSTILTAETALPGGPLEMVFIRAPRLVEAGPAVEVLARRDGLISDQVTDVAFARDGMTLATPAGLTFFTSGGATSLYAFQGLVNNHVYALAAERGSGKVLAGTLGGISILDDERVMQNLTLKNSGLKRNWITAIVRVDGADGPGWFVGTYGGGVVKMDAAGRVVGMDGVDTRAVINPTAMLVTERHVLAGSLEGGLLVYDRAAQRWSSLTSGLPSMDVTALAERGGEIYVGTENGLVRIAEARLP